MPSLQHLREFEELLGGYQPSDEAISSLRQSSLVFLTAPSGVGRNTLMNQLVKGGKFEILVSDTTRPPRVNDGILEQNGKEYFFVSEERFLEGLKAGKYLEAAVIHNAQVSGIRIDTFETIHATGKTPISDIEIAGVDYYRSIKPDVICIFVLPPSFEVWMSRLKERGEMAENEFRERMHSAKFELEHALDHDYYRFIVNSDLVKAAKSVQKIVDGKVYSEDGDMKKLAAELLSKIEKARY